MANDDLLRHWDTVDALEFGHVLKLAVGIDPYSKVPVDDPTAAKLRLLFEHMQQSHLRATNWAFDFAQHGRRLGMRKFGQLFKLASPKIPVDGDASKFVKSPKALPSLKYHASERGLLPTNELQELFEQAYSSGFGVGYTVERIATTEELQFHQSLDRRVIAEWFVFSGWRTEYQFDRAFSNKTAEPVGSKIEISPTIEDRLRNHIAFESVRTMSDVDVRNLHAKYKGEGVRAYTKKVAQEANISEVRVRQIVANGSKKVRAKAAWFTA